ncbi:hypothetical protein [Sphingomonas astaxanthinifaciens]|uniref:Uncharacterized protein n=1 Tax=Sphingomonas astaxanthinifaciens DSM 22298 TaxID=1123267 RepID=A0ABQ5ZBQ4_9SPHN|nr:hypothetical protein [Sphingomonas astaxanthinifaciens]GLR48219.1 hypothetical protein GCM10007925_19320 [Sphingomonas astaxanthinifaciens DSM 22298]
MLRVYAIGGVILFAGTAMLVQKVDHSMNYVPVMASITSVKSELCYLKKVDRGLVTKTTSTTGKMPCDEAEDLRLHNPTYAGMKALGYMDVSFSYVSPADHRQHSDTMSYAFDDYSRLAHAEGAQLPILAHKSDPAQTAHDYDHMAAFASPEA